LIGHVPADYRSRRKEVLMKKTTYALLAVTAAALLATPAHARSRTDHRPASDYTPLDKFSRGLAGMTTGVLELPGNIAAENRESGAGSAATIGFAKGLGMIPVRELLGVFNFVTAPIPWPNGYAPIMEPEYPWRYFEGAPPARLSSYIRGETVGSTAGRR
jgi:putative exosortase-associated protein (TIGR04073 family)